MDHAARGIMARAKYVKNIVRMTARQYPPTRAAKLVAADADCDVRTAARALHEGSSAIRKHATARRIAAAMRALNIPDVAPAEAS